MISINKSKISLFFLLLFVPASLVRAVVPNDASFLQQWALQEKSIGWLAGKQIFDEFFPPESIPDHDSPVAAIIDISFKYHQDLPRRTYLYNGTNYIVRHQRSNGLYLVEPNLNDENIGGHGNDSLGVMAAATDNHIGIAGSGFGKIKVLAVDAHYVDEKDQDINGMETESLIKAIDFIIEQKKKTNIVAVNMSFVSPSNELTEAIDRLKAHNIIVVAAAGNYGKNVSQTAYFPAAAEPENIISVAELGRDLKLTPSSNFGGNVSIAAPGEGMLSFGVNNDYIQAGGSSAAAPFVTGTLVAGVALYNQKRKQGFQYDDITAAQLINLLYQTANTHPVLEGKVEKGRYINVEKFMQGILACQQEAIQNKSGCSLSKIYPKRVKLATQNSLAPDGMVIPSKLSLFAGKISGLQPYLLGVLGIGIFLLIWLQKKK